MKYIFLVLMAFGSLGFQGQTWTIDQCIDYAIKNNISIKQGALNVQTAKNNVLVSKASVLPNLNLGAAHTYNFGKTIDRFTNTFADQMVLSQNVFVSTSVTLWSGLSQYNTIKQNELAYLSAAENVKQNQNDLALNVATAFLQVVYAKQLIGVQELQVNMSSEQLERTKKLIDAGTIAPGNIFDIEAQLATDEYNLTSANSNYQISLLTLKQLMNLDTAANFNIQQPILDPGQSEIDKINVVSVYNEALKNQPLIKSAEYAWKSAEKGLSVAKGGRSPSLLLSGGLGTGYSGLNYNYDFTYSSYLAGYTSSLDSVFLIQPNAIQKGVKSFADQYSANINKSISLQLNIPIFTGLRTHINVENNKLNLLNQKLNYDLARQQLFKNIAQAHANAVAAMDKYKSSKIATEAAEKSFQFSETKFNAGAISSFEFSTAKNRWMKAQADLLNAKFDYIFRLKVLDFYQGKPLTF
ncbi:MAG: TolC family protein [Bacteroidota bacterium]|jgi:outer membrane protein